MSKTATELVTDVLLDLSIISTEETPSAEQYNTVYNRYLLLQQEMETLGLGAWDTAAIPEPIYLALVGYIAARLAPLFGVTNAASPDDALVQFRRVQMVNGTGRQLTIEVF
jgi:hypothetical protein